jgi:2-isopropylmalate synthase
VDERSHGKNGEIITMAEAKIKIKIGNKISMAISKGNGPVNALDKALRKALSRKYPILKNIKLSDYKVRILTPSDGTQAITRVQIESCNEKGEVWTTIGVSQNIIDASFWALHDSMTYCLIRQ